MTTAELAREIPVPTDARGNRHRAVCVVDHRAGDTPGTGTTTYGVAFFDGLRPGAPVGVPFDRPRKATAFATLINGETPIPRSAPETLPVGLGAAVEVTPGRPDIALPDREHDGSVCAGCGGPVPTGRHGQRRTTCSRACRVAVHRRHATEAGRAAPIGATASVTPSATVQPSLGLADG